MNEGELRLKLAIRHFDRVSLVAFAIAAVPIAAMNFFLPHQGWLLFGAFLFCVYLTAWVINRRRIKAACERELQAEERSLPKT
jgi:hypothetical protein